MSTVSDNAEPLATPTAGSRVDPRLAVFRSPAALEVFHSVCQKDQIWRFDRLDVHDIHEDARLAFYDLIERPVTPTGHLLLLKGEAGSGKTHLMRAFRNHVHENRLGFCGYMQMTTATEDYDRYILANLIDSLDDPYFELEGDRSSLLTLSNLVVEARDVLTPHELNRFRQDELDDLELARLTADFADRFISQPGFGRLDGDLIRALAYLQRSDPKIHARVLKYLRCEPLNTFDRKYLPELEPRLHPQHPRETVERLGQLLAAVEQRRLVLLVDQLEEMASFDDQPQLAEIRFRRAMQSLCGIIGRVPGAIGVIACLEDLYAELARSLTMSIRDRIEQDPQPVRLEANRSLLEIEKLMARRLNVLYDNAGVPNDEPLYPFPPEFLGKLSQLRTRDVLESCRRFREGTTSTEAVVAPPRMAAPREAQLALAWNDHKAAWQFTVPDAEEEQAEFLAWALAACGEELDPPRQFTVERNGRKVTVGNLPSTGGRRRGIAVCNRGTQGGGLTTQVRELLSELTDELPVVVRSAAFPTSPRTKISKLLGELVTRGGLRVAFEDAHWRQILALRQFSQAHSTDESFRQWRRRERPLANLKPIATILGLDQLVGADTSPASDATPSPLVTAAATAAPAELAAPNESAAAPPTVLLRAGQTDDVAPSPVVLELAKCTQHVAFLGGSGSGKTTVALNLLEQLALAGVPAIFIDRKGDLCGYADKRWWDGVASGHGSPELDARRRALRERLDVRLYTPGESRGRPLSIPLMPPEMASIASHDQEAVAKVTAAALAGMMGYKTSARNNLQLHALLYQAVLLLGQQQTVPVTVANLADFIGHQDATLLNAIGWIDPRLCKKLAQELQAVEIQYRTLLSLDHELLDVERLLGVGEHARPRRTRWTIISTKFLRDLAAVEFWVAQFLVAVERWLSRRPSDRLQGVLLLDEADMYLPSVRQPATKMPLENLLKRARSAGLGLFLATQSPGDFDYKCRENIRSWFLGRIKEEPAQRKLRSVFDQRPELVSKLAGQETGQFTLVRDGQPTEFRADRSALETRQLTEDRIVELAAQE